MSPEIKTSNETNLTSKADVTPLGSSSVKYPDVTLSDPLYRPTITAEVGSIRPSRSFSKMPEKPYSMDG